MTERGFYSVVQKEGDKHLTVRARARDDLEWLREKYLPGLGEIIDGGGGDYPFRAPASHDAFADALHSLALGIDYPNFKEAVAESMGSARASVYSKVWTALKGIEKSGSKKKKSAVQLSSRYGGVVLDARGRFLLMEPKDHFDGYAWTFPKTRAEPGETGERAGERAILTKTGITAHTCVDVPGWHASGSSRTHYWVMRAGHDAPGLLGPKTASIRWANFDEAHELISQSKNTKGRERDLVVLEAARQATLAWFPGGTRRPDPRSDPASSRTWARLPAPISTVRGVGDTRSVVFPPGSNGEAVIRSGEGWARWRLADGKVEPLPLQGDVASFLRNADRVFLLTGGGDGHTKADILPWPPERATTIELSFALLAGSPRGSFLARFNPIRYVTEISAAPWSRCDPKHISFRFDLLAEDMYNAWPIRLLWTSDERYLVLPNAGTQLSFVDVETRREHLVFLDILSGHPVWGDVHPTRPLAAVFSYNAVVIDLEQRRITHRLDHGSSGNVGGEFTPDGAWLAMVTYWRLVLRHLESGEERVLDVPGDEPLGETPIRFTPDGEYAIVALGNSLAAYHTSTLLQ